MKIATWNVNSIRRRLTLVLDWVAQNNPDVLCLQETKVQDSEFPVQEFKDAGYHAAFRGMKGYNGVATLSRAVPEKIIHGMRPGNEEDEVRILQTVIDGTPIVNTYVPQGNLITSEKYQAKLVFFSHLSEYFGKHLDPAKPAIWLGDLNVAPEPIDVYHPDRRVNDVDFHIDARNAYKQAVAWGFVDTFRKLHPERVQYTYWDYFRQAFERNFGWRIDHILVTEPLAAKCRVSEVDMAARKGTGASDHTVVFAEF